MKTSIRTLFVAGALLLAAGAGVVLFAKEEAASVGSIRPAGKVADADLPSLAGITFQQALDTALAKSPGSVIKAELEVEDGTLMYSFEIVGTNRKITEVEIDAGNGKVLKTEDEEEEEKAEAKNEKADAPKK